VLLEQALVNVLDNAAKYSPEWSVVRVTARRQGQTLLLEVIDDGPGIPQTDLKRVFDKFYRVELGDRQGAGAGLGLSICKGIVEAHGGTITAVSPVEAGHGTAFVIRLPIEPQPAAAEVTTEIQ
jgi:two-component system sensor histidine kinase KdpD